MGIEPTWDFVEPHHGFEDQERHQVALRLQEDESRCLRMAPQGSASTCTVRVTPLPFMKQTARHINMNTEWLCRLKLCRFWLAGNLLGQAIQLGVQFVQVESFSGHAVGLIRQNEPG